MATLPLDPSADRFGARRLLPRDAVIHRAEGAWLYDIDGHRYLDCLTVASGALQGHSHPRVMRAMAEQAARMTLHDAGAIRNDHLDALVTRLAAITHQEVVVLRHSVADATGVALDVARRLGAAQKGVQEAHARIVTFRGNALGLGGWPAPEVPRYPRAVVTPQPGYSLVRFGDLDALPHVLTPDVVALVMAPVLTSHGLEFPPDGYLAAVAGLCRERNIVLVVDETQTCFGRLGEVMACDAEQVVPDIVLLGRSLSSGFYPVAAMGANGAAGNLLRGEPHDVTFVQNPLGCAVACAAADVVVDERLAARARELGAELLTLLQGIRSPYVRRVTGRGLWVSIELTCAAHAFNEALMDAGVAVDDPHDHTIRLSPALTVSRAEIGWLVDRVARILDDRSVPFAFGRA